MIHALLPLMLTWPLAPAPLALEDAVKLPDQTIAPKQVVDLQLPPLPAKAGRVVVLRFKAFSQSPGESGCNYNGAVRLNGLPLGRTVAGGEPRLIGRSNTLELTREHLSFAVCNGPDLMLVYAPDADRGDKVTTDGQGATFTLNISDAARGVDGNTVTFVNRLAAILPGGAGTMLVRQIEVGWADRATLPRTEARVPVRGALTHAVEAGGLRLSWGRGGGFAVRGASGVELIVDTALGVAAITKPALTADETAAAVPVEAKPWGPSGYRLVATWPDLRLERWVELRAGLVEWTERWTNTGAAVRSVPLRHQMFLREQAANWYVSGSEDSLAMASVAQNPTLYADSPERRGQGLGLTIESDRLRLVAGLTVHGGVGELYSTTLALAPGSSFDARLTIAPVTDGGGYWSFLNALRQRWGVNGVTMDRPLFWGYTRQPGVKDPVEQARQALGHLGPLYVTPGPWFRLEPDAYEVRAGRYPKLPAGAPPAPGKCPDFDAEKWLTLAHREPYWQQFATDVKSIHQGAPEAKVLGMMHPAMEAVYQPLLDRWPYAADAIITPEGAPMNEPGYSKAWVGDWTKKDWGVVYFVPRPGSAYLQALLADLPRALDQLGADGIYCDEFSWAFTVRSYSRYDYSRWDGYSADLDAEGKVTRLKSDNAEATESAQLRLVGEVLRRGKFFLGNGSNALRSLHAGPQQRFVEGGNGHAWIAQGHLSPVPLVLGNFGHEDTLQGVFDGVRQCLSQGSVYSPMSSNLLLPGRDNFVCRLYPITVRELGPGWVVGAERVATTVSRKFAWPGAPAKVRLLRWTATGQPAEAPRVIDAGAELALEVPENGLVIAERVTSDAR